MDKSRNNMKENKLIELKNRVDSLTKLARSLVAEMHKCVSMSQGTLTALQLHVGEKEWVKIVEELKDKEKRMIEQEQEKKLDLNVE